MDSTHIANTRGLNPPILTVLSQRFGKSTPKTACMSLYFALTEPLPTLRDVSIAPSNLAGRPRGGKGLPGLGRPPGEDPTPEIRDQAAIGLVDLDDIERVVAKEFLARMGNVLRCLSLR